MLRTGNRELRALVNWELDGNWDLACQRQMFYMRVVAPLAAAPAASLAASPAGGGGNNVLFGGRINKLGLGSELALPAAVAAAAVPGKAHNSSFYLWDFGMACQSCVCDAAATLTYPGLLHSPLFLRVCVRPSARMGIRNAFNSNAD